MPRVLHVSEVIQGGTATYLNTLLPLQLAHPRLDAVALLVTTENQRHLTHLPAHALIPYDSPGRGLRGAAALVSALRRTVRTFRPDLLHLHGSIAGAVGRLLPKRGARIVTCAHGWSFLIDTSRGKQRAYALAERLLAARADAIICISDDEYQAARAVGIPAARLIRVHNGLPVDPPPAEPVELPPAAAAARAAGATVFLFVGRYDKQKGLDLLLDAFTDLPAGRAVLLAVGGSVVGGPQPRWGANTFDLGWASPGQVTGWLSLCDALVIPSRWEGFGLVATEAMRAGRAVLASRRGGLPEVVADGQTGRLFDPHDPDELRRALLESSPNELAAWGAAGRERFLAHFTDTRLHEEMLAVYEGCWRRG